MAAVATENNASHVTAPLDDNAKPAAAPSGGRRLPFARGIFWPPFCQDWESRLDALATFEPREDDVFVVSYPKCGHHWSFEFLSMIINGNNELAKGSLLLVLSAFFYS